MNTASRILLSSLTCACAALLARPAYCEDSPAASATADKDGGDLDIGLSKPEAHKAADREKGLALCRKFNYDDESFVDAKLIEADGAALARDYSAKNLLIECLDARNVSDPALRTGALNALNAAKFTGAEVSRALAAVVVVDPKEKVREAAVAAIKMRKDADAEKLVLDYLLATYDEHGNVKALAEHDNALDAARALGANDNRIYQTLLEKAYYATVETRVTNTQLVNFVTRQIDSYTVNSGAQVNIILRLSFPIQFPELAITRVRTTVKAPCINALEEMTGQAFGADMDKWDKWVRKHQ